MKSFDDDELIEKSKAGDILAFKSLVSRYEGKVASVVVSLIGNLPIAEDIGQEVFLRFYDSLPKIHGGVSLDAYLLTIAVDISMGHLKSYKRSSTHLPSPEIAGSNRSNNELLDFNEQLHFEFSDLSPEFKSVVTLRLINGYSIEDTANILKVPSETVLTRLALAQHKLRNGLSKQFK